MSLSYCQSQNPSQPDRYAARTPPTLAHWAPPKQGPPHRHAKDPRQDRPSPPDPKSEPPSEAPQVEPPSPQPMNQPPCNGPRRHEDSSPGPAAHQTAHATGRRPPQE
ncbi:acidic proline-rich protein PRP25-like [Gouania willdenowi]|uniref:acidic proline-rich protein PRP25-like n=1 Tax=Gouania willdenowi TaxID=441366 RepID=UPI001056AD50|nr:acidic proline-rich protein PRP25-like [Gouania willdenowi]